MCTDSYNMPSNMPSVMSHLKVGQRGGMHDCAIDQKRNSCENIASEINKNSLTPTQMCNGKNEDTFDVKHNNNINST